MRGCSFRNQVLGLFVQGPGQPQEPVSCGYRKREREREPESTSRISYFSGLAVHTQAFTVVVRLVAWTGIQELEGFGEPRRGDGTYGIVGCLRALNLRRSLIHKTRDVVVASVGPVLQEWGERARTVLRASYPELSSLSLRREP